MPTVIDLRPKSQSGVNVIDKTSAESECLFCSNTDSKAVLRSYLEMTFKKPSSSTDLVVDIYAGRLYTIKWYDTCAGGIRTTSGSVLGFNEERLCLSSTSINSGSENVCLNSNADKLSTLTNTQVFNIPLVNIIDVKEVLDTPECPDETQKEKRKTIVAVLGLSSTVVRALMVDLKIYADDCETAVDEVRLEVGGVYHVTYAPYEGTNDTLYEIEGRLIRIEEIGLLGSEQNYDGYVRPECPHQCEEVGYNGNVYDHYMSLPKHNPDASRIKLVFDTSKEFERTIDSVMLGAIRNVSRITDENPNPPEPEPWYPPCPPCPDDCHPTPPPVQPPHRPCPPPPPPPQCGPWGPPPPWPPQQWPPIGGGDGMWPGHWGGCGGSTPPPPGGWIYPEHPDHPGCEINKPKW